MFRTKSDKQISAEIQAIIRQITASVSFLPVIMEHCSFELLVYTDKSRLAQVPAEWEDSGPKYVVNSEQVKLRSFSTTVHKIEPVVAYKAPVV